MELSSKVALDTSGNMNSRKIDAMGDLSRSVSVTEKLLIQRIDEDQEENKGKSIMQVAKDYGKGFKAVFTNPIVRWILVAQVLRDWSS